jgi:hypothetical protein
VRTAAGPQLGRTVPTGRDSSGPRWARQISTKTSCPPQAGKLRQGFGGQAPTQRHTKKSTPSNHRRGSKRLIPFHRRGAEHAKKTVKAHLSARRHQDTKKHQEQHTRSTNQGQHIRSRREEKKDGPLRSKRAAARPGRASAAVLTQSTPRTQRKARQCTPVKSRARHPGPPAAGKLRQGYAGAGRRAPIRRKANLA